MSLIPPPTVFPSWFIQAPLNATFSAQEVAQLMGYKTPACVWSAVLNKHFPEPTIRSGFGPGNLHRKGNWSKKCILQEIKRRKSLKGENDGEV